MGIPSAAFLLGLLDVMNECSMRKGLSEPRNICATTSLHLSLPHPPEGGWVPQQGDPLQQSQARRGHLPPGQAAGTPPACSSPLPTSAGGSPAPVPAAAVRWCHLLGAPWGRHRHPPLPRCPRAAAPPGPEPPPKAHGKGFRRLGAGWCLGQGEASPPGAAPQENTAQCSPRVEMRAPP